MRIINSDIMFYHEREALSLRERGARNQFFDENSQFSVVNNTFIKIS